MTGKIKYSYTTEDHENAFQVWCDTGSWTRTAEAMRGHAGLLSKASNAKNWAKDNFNCAFSCPWHGWHKLKAERSKALAVSLGPGINASEKAIMLAQPPPPPGIGNHGPTRQDALKNVVRSDIERLAHLEVMYAKAVYHATGLVIPCPSVINGEGGIANDIMIRELFTSAHSRAPTFAAAVSATTAILEQINKIVEAAGLRRTADGSASGLPDLSAKDKKATLEDLRATKAFIEKWHETPEGQRGLLLQQLKSEEATLDAQIPAPASSGGDQQPDPGLLPGIGRPGELSPPTID